MLCEPGYMAPGLWVVEIEASGENTYGLNVDARESFDQIRHGVEAIVDAFQEDRLVAHDDPVLEQIIGSLLRHPGDFARMVDMSVKADLLPYVPTLVR
jgi:hypothetical protein